MRFVNEAGKLEGHSSAFLSGSQRTSYMKTGGDNAPGPGLYDQHASTIQQETGTLAPKLTEPEEPAKSTTGLLTENVKL